jgi:hypothetical protein
MQYALIQRSNSGQSYVYGLFNTEAQAEQFAKDNFVDRACTWNVATFFPAISHKEK